ncbi:hypothetical protein HPB49_022115 [Dermacentor silvarum]|uniref:Uncharacterized protein n=1 Tax=Dermacentor silvarum TaxID=543639 RepID=A0ACB8E3N8_DERSI|nr:hypothetical protein HPB49_022115 [Dermacentor silvarum]
MAGQKSESGRRELKRARVPLGVHPRRSGGQFPGSGRTAALVRDRSQSGQSPRCRGKDRRVNPGLGRAAAESADVVPALCGEPSGGAPRSGLERTFSDSEFEDSVASYMQSWLPNVPTPSEEHFKSMTKEEAYKTTFGYVQYYAVGLEQAVLDQIFHNGPFHRLFLEIQQNLGQLLCELQIGIVHFSVAKNPDVLRDVMSHEYRDIKQDSQRNLRDYIILREYIRLTRYISELFAYLRDHS